ncbi:transmembrane protease serine 11C [Chelonia mydas]|uniref:transmembrane protease serine 11C n=1 Tax=Chelonia mydas TaxID=8469 RepID=UPI001CA823B0|nr:transmembrane protease serine 11C [Chelonia mydas]
MYFYNGTFKITNVQYNREFDKHTSKEYRDLSTSIEMLVTNTFRASIFNKKYIRSHVVNLRPDASGVVVELVLIFEFASNDNRKAFSERIKSILLRRLQTNTGGLEIDLSTFKLSGKFLELSLFSLILLLRPSLSSVQLMKKENGEHLFNNCCGIRTSKSLSYTNRITGGISAQVGEWPWQASLQLSGIHRCGATLISNTWLITAAHCFRGQQNPSRWTASFGTVIRPPHSRRSIRNIIVHEKYTDAVQTHNYDIAVVQLSSPVEFTNVIRMVCLPEEFYVFPHNTTCFVTGWGALQNEGSSINNLRQAEVKIIDTNICNRAEVYNGAIAPGMVCAGYLEGEIDACQGDSGGPLVTEDRRGVWFLVGIVSWGDECAKKNKPGVYTRVTYYRDWIAAKTGL